MALPSTISEAPLEYTCAVAPGHPMSHDSAVCFSPVRTHIGRVEGLDAIFVTEPNWDPRDLVSERVKK